VVEESGEDCLGRVAGWAAGCILTLTVRCSRDLGRVARVSIRRRRRGRDTILLDQVVCRDLVVEGLEEGGPDRLEEAQEEWVVVLEGLAAAISSEGVTG
jgi:hypothetical protein